jgi:hypothetical protein
VRGGGESPTGREREQSLVSVFWGGIVLAHAVGVVVAGDRLGGGRCAVLVDGRDDELLVDGVIFARSHWFLAAHFREINQKRGSGAPAGITACRRHWTASLVNCRR